MEFWSEEFEELNRIMEKHACLYDISTKAFSDRVTKAAALENISQEMNVAGWYITHHSAALGTKSRLTCFALTERRTDAVQLGQLHCRSSATVELRR